jgi:hypothetical protein
MGIRELIKRTASGFLALVYLLTTLGTVVSTHYCMGRVAGVRWFQASADPCGAQSHGCCHTDVKVFKLDDVHQGAVVTLAFSAPAIAPVPFVIPHAFVSVVPARSAPAVHAPPDVGVLPLYLRHCHFTI